MSAIFLFNKKLTEQIFKIFKASLALIVKAF